MIVGNRLYESIDGYLSPIVEADLASGRVTINIVCGEYSADEADAIANAIAKAVCFAAEDDGDIEEADGGRCA